MDAFEKNILKIYKDEARSSEGKSLQAYRSDPLFTDIPDPVRKLSLGLFHPLRHETLSPGQGSVIDLGCGSGFDLYYLSRKYPEYSLFGADLSPDLLERGRKVLQDAGCSPMLVLSNARQIAFRENSADLVLAHAVIHLSTARQEIISEAFRVLKPGGSLLFCDPVVNSKMPGFFRAEYEKSGGVFLYGGLAMIGDYQLWAEKAGFSYFDVLEKRDFDPVPEIKKLLCRRYGDLPLPEQELDRLSFSIYTVSLEKQREWGRRRTRCPECGADCLVDFRSVIDRRRQARLSDLVKRGVLNFGSCPDCRETLDCPEPFLYISDRLVVNKLPEDYRGKPVPLDAELRHIAPSMEVRTVYSKAEFDEAIKKPWWKIW